MSPGEDLPSITLLSWVAGPFAWLELLWTEEKSGSLSTVKRPGAERRAVHGKEEPTEAVKWCPLKGKRYPTYEIESMVQAGRRSTTNCEVGIMQNMLKGIASL